MADLPVPTVSLAGDFTVDTVIGRVETDSFLVDEGYPVVDEELFKSAMRALPAGVVMVTVRIDRRPWGLTISSCCSLTLRPPQILISLRLATESAKAILRDRRFGVSVLAADQRPLAEHGAAPGVAKFIDEYCVGADCEPVASPIVSGALFHLDCRVADTHQVGDHMLFVGLVERAESSRTEDDRQPLLFFDRRFWQLGRPV
jgi:flavin reductase ActVB